MSDTPTDRQSLVSQRLSAPIAVEPIDPEPHEERTKLARSREGTKALGWRLHRLLGVGPVSAAYEAFFGEDGPPEQRDHAVVKLLVGSVAKNEQARALFLRSAYAANRFRHPRVVGIALDGVDDEGSSFVVRQWHDAKPLDAVVESDTLTEAKVLRIAEQVLDALELAHSHGIIHGAITPSNILVNARGSMRLCDFATPPGVTATATGAPSSDAGDRDLLGTLRIGPFTAPERCETPAVAGAEPADIYALAACMYFALTKKYARGAAATREELATAAVIPVRDALPTGTTVTDSFAAIIDHALQREPVRRYDSAYAMLGDVRRAMAGRRPKLHGALRPIPSGSYKQPALPEGSSRHVPALADVSVDTRVRRDKREWRGNVVLILAIALLVGVATFVLVREKRDDATESPAQPTQSFH
jgi:serine/threonine protein kinase